MTRTRLGNIRAKIEGEMFAILQSMKLVMLT